MNVHDSNRIAGLLEQVGYKPASQADNAGVFVINTCAVRENARTKLFGHIGQLAQIKRNNPELILAIGGCLAQSEREQLLKHNAQVDIVFGTYNIHALPKLLRQFQHNREPQIEILDHFESSIADLPSAWNNPFSKYVSISVGCDQRCTFCIVPAVRGPQIDRSAPKILEEVKHLQTQGVQEITLLGQNVNAYGKTGGVHFHHLLEQVAKLGVPRIRFMSPHPGYFTDPVIEIMQKYDNIMPHIHFPLQSGSDQVLKRMQRGYTIEHFLKTLKKIRIALPNLEVTTDIIVGFPGETLADHRLTLQALEIAQFISAFVFVYSPRPGTKSLKMTSPVDPMIVSHRFNELVDLQEDITLIQMSKYLDKTVEVFVNEIGKKDAKHHRISGRSPQNILVHLDKAENLSIGDTVQARVIRTAPHYLIAEVQ
jgi:tRNA-2-methylthio-N6-dimethylallyladenosine synthase